MEMREDPAITCLSDLTGKIAAKLFSPNSTFMPKCAVHNVCPLWLLVLVAVRLLPC